MNELKQYYAHRLEQLGYDDDMDIRYSLGYSQGDGMAFYGKIENHEVLIGRFTAHLEGKQPSVYMRLKARRSISSLNRYIALLVQLSTADIEISTTDYGRYNHYNSMDVDTEALEVEELIELIEDENNNVDDRPGLLFDAAQGYSLWNEYLDWLKEDVSDTSRTLEREGYNILSAMCSEPRVVWEKTTPQYAVVVELQGDEDGLNSWDEGLAIDTLTEFASEQGSCYSLSATVKCLVSGVILARTSLSGIHSAKSLLDADGRDGGHLAEQVYEALADAKAYVCQTVMKAA